MYVKSDKLNCYLEGIRVPIVKLDATYNRNELKKAQIKLLLDSNLLPQVWANALIQVTYIDNFKEKLFYQGLVSSIDVLDDVGFMVLNTDSEWSVFNLNTTLDYVAPKKYGIQNIEDEITIFLGNEEEITTVNENISNYSLSQRYFFLNTENQDYKNYISLEDSETYKLQYIADRTPFASLFAYSFFEDISYQNFYLTRSYVDRFNLLKKIDSDSRILDFEAQRLQSTIETENLLELDTNRSGLYIAITKRNVEVVNDIKQNPNGTVVVGSVRCLTFPQLSDDRVKQKINEFYKKYPVHSGFTVDMLFEPCKRLNVNPILIAAIAHQESNGGTSGKGKRTKNPGNLGNTNEGGTVASDQWAAGWFLTINQVARRMAGKRGSPSKSIENLGGMDGGRKVDSYPVWAYPDLATWINNVTNFFQSVNGCEGF